MGSKIGSAPKGELVGASITDSVKFPVTGSYYVQMSGLWTYINSKLSTANLQVAKLGVGVAASNHLISAGTASPLVAGNRLWVGNASGYSGYDCGENAYNRWFVIFDQTNCEAVMGTIIGGSAGSLYMTNTYLGVFTSSVDANYCFQLPNDVAKKAKAQAWDTYSDSRFKFNQVPLEYGWSDFLKLQPKRFDYLRQLNTIGFIAQEVYEVYPEAANKPTDESKESWSLNSDKILAGVVAGFQDFYHNHYSSKINDIEARLAALEGA